MEVTIHASLILFNVLSIIMHALQSCMCINFLHLVDPHCVLIHMQMSMPFYHGTYRIWFSRHSATLS